MRSNTGRPNSAIVFRTLWPGLTVVTCLGELRVHDEAVRPTLDWIEDTVLVARGWNPGPWQSGGDFPPHRSRNPDSQFNTCAVIANMTRDDQGRWRNTEPLPLVLHTGNDAFSIDRPLAPCVTLGLARPPPKNGCRSPGFSGITRHWARFAMLGPDRADSGQGGFRQPGAPVCSSNSSMSSPK